MGKVRWNKKLKRVFNLDQGSSKAEERKELEQVLNRGQDSSNYCRSIMVLSIMVLILGGAINYMAGSSQQDL